MKNIKLHICFYIFIVCFTSCSKEKLDYTFKSLPPSQTSINFINKITENDSLNVINFQYIYNGGGVGIGDFNNDGLSDVVFTGNQTSSKVYLNKGEFNFIDISKDANFKTQSWVTGVSIVDINADGWDDIYLSVGGSDCKNNCENLLFINKGLNKKGIPIFEERAKAYNLNEANYCQQAVFFDYDLDGDLDVFIARNGNVKFDKNAPVPKRYMPNHLTDVLLRNDSKEGISHPVYTNVSDSLGVTHKGFSLGVTIQDINNDNLPDIYVSNDFITEDLLYINQGVSRATNKHLGFKDCNKQFLSHQTYNAMGVDIADINNDTYPDVLVLDMLPESYARQKTMLGSMNYDKYLIAQRNKYSSQYMHNTLQINNGVYNDSLIKASEIGFYSGMASTDWSWAPLLADFDNDGDKDTYITNGYVKDITDLDFINYSKTNVVFGTEKARNEMLNELIDKAPGVDLPNYFYKNNGNLKFKDVSKTWLASKNSFSNGAAYADLDNDGDLDIIVNNINEKAFVIENNTSSKNNSNFIRLQLKGYKKNKHAIGSKVNLWSNGNVQQQYQSVIRGYLSSVEPIIHFGLKTNTIDSIQVIWPDKKVSKLSNIPANTTLDINYDSATHILTNIVSTSKTILTENNSILQYTHKENQGHDYVTQHLLTKQHSKFGPCIESANIDGKIGDEIFIGGSKGSPSSIWFQNKQGVFEKKQEFDAEFEDADAVFIDIDNDTDLDLYIASGSTDFTNNSKYLQDRIYLNDSKGQFTLVNNTLPNVTQISSCVRPNDFDKDGDIDFFIGSRVVQGRYPETPKSQLLKNNQSNFSKVNNQILENIGMVTDAIWSDINLDGWDDLIIVGEWMSITTFINNKGKLEKQNFSFVNENNESIETFGWWNAIKAADFDNDGDIDFVVGNQGANNFITPTKNQPIYVYKKDFDNNGSIDPILAKYYADINNKSELRITHSRDDVMKQLPSLKNTYLNYKDFSSANFIEVLKIKDLETETLKATTFTSSYLENIGNNTFKIKPLPEACQIAPINNFLVKDIDNDGFKDILLVGNNNTSESVHGKNDAFLGLYLKNDKGNFKSVKIQESGFYIPGQSYHIIEAIGNKNEKLIFAMQNDDKAKVFLLK